MPVPPFGGSASAETPSGFAFLFALVSSGRLMASPFLVLETIARSLVTFILLGASLEMRAAAAPRVFVVGWDGADWKLLDALVKEGRMPSLGALLRKGRSWNLASYEPMASPLIWTTLATGRTPVDHGVTDFQELDPATRARLPISGRARKVPALWNLASLRGLRVGVVGWWATWPAEKVNGFLVSDRSSPVLSDPEVLARSPALTWPESLADGVRAVGRREGTPGFEDVSKALAVTRAEFDAAVARRKDLADPITGYQKILGSTRVYARIATELYERQKPDLLMVYLEGTDEIGHVLGRYVPPKLPDVSDEEFRKYSRGVAILYEEADRFLGKLLELAERDHATLVLVSDHGFKWSDRPRTSSLEFNTAFQWHESPGILAAAGPGVVPSAVRGKASVFDVAPTLCRLLGLPADPAFEGKPVAGLDARRLPPAAPPISWEKSVKVERLVVSTGAEEKKAGEEFTKKLISLGYLTGAEASAVDARPADRAGTETSGSFMNVGTFLRVRGKVSESLPWYHRALEAQPTSASAWMNLSNALAALRRWDESDDALLSAVRNGYGDPPAALQRRTVMYNDLAKKDPAAEKQLGSFLRKLIGAFPSNDSYQRLYGHYLLRAKECGEAEKIFGALATRNPRDTEALNVEAISLVCLGRPAEARVLFERSLAIDPVQERVRRALSSLEKEGAPRR
jgi:tetratricopeptide (TPR) repeat protein